MILYRLDKKTRSNVRMIDVWGISRSELSSLPGISLVIGPTVWESLTILVQFTQAQACVSEIVSRYGAIDLDTVQR